MNKPYTEYTPYSKNLFQVFMPDGTQALCYDLRMAVLRPDQTTRMPGYYIVIARTKKKELLFIEEGESPGASSILGLAAEAGNRLACHVAYTSKETADESKDLFVCLAIDIVDQKSLSTIICPPYEDVQLAIDLMGRWSFNPPRRSTILQQLSIVSGSTVENPNNYAIRAFFMLLVEFDQDREPHTINLMLRRFMQREHEAKLEKRRMLDPQSRQFWAHYDERLKNAIEKGALN